MVADIISCSLHRCVPYPFGAYGYHSGAPHPARANLTHTTPDHLSLKNFSQAGFQELPKNVAGSGLAAYVASLLDAA